MYNKLIDVNDVELILNRFGPIGDNGDALKVKNIDLFRTACVHTSYMEEMDLKIAFIPREDWNRLEFIGDKALAYLSAFEMFSKYPSAQEAILTNLTIGLTRQSRLTDYGIRLNLSPFMLLPPSQDNLARNNVSFSRLHACNLEDMMESFIGAIVVDNGGLIQGLQYAHRFINNLLTSFVDFDALEESIQDFKGPLINEIQVMKLGELQIIKLQRRAFAVSTYGVAVSKKAFYNLFNQKEKLDAFVLNMKRQLEGYDLSDCPASHIIIGKGSQKYGIKKADKVQEACKEALALLKQF